MENVVKDESWRKVRETIEDVNFVERGFFQQIDHPETGPQTYPGYQFQIHTEPPRGPRQRAPLLGEHTTEVLSELGLSAAELSELRAAGVIGAAVEALDAAGA